MKQTTSSGTTRPQWRRSWRNGYLAALAGSVQIVAVWPGNRGRCVARWIAARWIRDRAPGQLEVDAVTDLDLPPEVTAILDRSSGARGTP